ncbi:TPA: AAA family ATPase [Escherichia coli]|mgnify:FL=1|uniref:3'-5' exonuclease n=1 Tax=Escherichia coli TaxID=562 RepID=UPI0005A7A40F|nr:nuclease-related domain-containing DEAD/DEAH box helicase [Escherichia coli]ASO91068.1 hypothetical protein AKO63_4660 [Escherichia coli]EHT5195655.1 AAA family ATPase [Escherichia coli]EIK5645198.1 AAA family ATPase [Escherichia coli]EJN7407415.1 AAA family ATPase [Escherichia coli]EJS9526007.1 AAA family ATPase [Escherichia coli]
MATIIPTISSCNDKITAGEKRLARILERGLGEECCCWYDIPTGDKHLHPDFMILSPEKGIIFLEVKDWFITKIKKANKSNVLYETQNGIQSLKNPIEQVRRYAFEAVNQLKKDPLLCQQDDRYNGNLLFPYGYGVYFSNITREALNNKFTQEELLGIFPSDLIICKDEINEFMSKEDVSSKIHSLIKYDFKCHATQEQLNRVRWHLYPDVRIEREKRSKNRDEFSVDAPTIISILDTQQEQLARSMRDGHRIIHGVAGSGKTLILYHRCQELAKKNDSEKPILVICYNITLAKKLRSMFINHPFAEKIKVKNFHAWCFQQIKENKITIPEGDNIFDNMELALTDGFKTGKIKPEQYSAVLIDEGHDFKPEWLKILAKMTDSQDENLLFLYDDAQSIYQKKKALDFTLSSVDIKATGRTTILNINYRNTQQILHFASCIAFNYLNSHIDSSLTYHKPAAGGMNGDYPNLEHFDTQDEEIARAVEWITEQNEQGIPWSEIAILSPSTHTLSNSLSSVLESKNIPFNLIVSSADKKSWTPEQERISVMPLPSSKGLEFHSVVIIDAARTRDNSDDLSEDIKRLYVGFTRARCNLLVTLHGEGALNEHLLKTYEQSPQYM